ncbi:MAG: bifunctional riboflavin kinase/FAD synthetase [Actinomycetales bacterium]
MQRWSDVAEVPAGFGPTVVSLGNFDGVHRGHQWALARLVEQARARGAKAVAITFEPHPLHVLYPDRAPELITDLAGRLEIMQGTGLDAVLVLAFTRELASMTPREFVEQVLLKGLDACAVVVGHDMRFGVRNSGDLGTMRELGAELGFEVVVTDDLNGPHEGSGAERRWSSSWVREMLAAGDVRAVTRALGRDHRVVGEVVHGDHRGRELGFPTANLTQDSVGMVPADGVYAGWLVRLAAGLDDPDRRLPAAISVGTNPTFEGTQRRVEAYVLDRSDLDLYGQRVALEFVERLRPTLTFDGVEPLVAQMHTDVAQCRAILAGAAQSPQR